jgi:7-cyano-7-deazaguanine synthase
MKPIAIVLLSGGLDSTTAMWKVKESYSKIYALTFRYGSKDENVTQSITKKLSELVGASHKIIKLPWLKEFSKTAGTSLVSNKEIPSLTESELGEIQITKSSAKAVWVPARNLVFLSIAAAFAETIGEEVDIVAGFDYEEAETFPDNTLLFVDRMNDVLELAVLNKKIRIIAPLINMNKGKIAKLANELCVPVEFTSSCYRPLGLGETGKPVHCGTCESCLRRKRGFRTMGKDKTEYAPTF